MIARRASVGRSEIEVIFEVRERDWRLGMG